VERFGKSAAFAITVFTCRPLERQMRALGARTCSTRAVFFRYLPNLVPHYGIDWPDTLLAARDEVLAGYDVWADDVSRAEYVRQVRWQLALDAHPGESWPVAETYFPPDLVRFSDDGVFIDCGAFDGDTLRMVIDRRGDRFARFIGVEPDPENRARFEAYRATLAPALQSKISMVPAAIGAEPGVVRFQAEAWAGSKIADGGTVAVNVETIDRIASGTRPTFIKVDIEGAEPNAVEGGARVLSQDAPFVAICLYHAQWHLWRVPMRIRELNDDYELHLRRYSDDCWELVCYAAPHAS
jgi:FkbM family methyltransferase